MLTHKNTLKSRKSGKYHHLIQKISNIVIRWLKFSSKLDNSVQIFKITTWTHDGAKLSRIVQSAFSRLVEYPFCGLMSQTGWRRWVSKAYSSTKVGLPWLRSNPTCLVDTWRKKRNLRVLGSYKDNPNTRLPSVLVIRPFKSLSRKVIMQIAKRSVMSGYHESKLLDHKNRELEWQPWRRHREREKQ